MRTTHRSLSTMNSFEFHVSKTARERYAFDEQLFALNGNVVLADLGAARRFAASMTRVRGQNIPASDIHALGLIDEILHILIRQYEMQNPDVMRRALAALGMEAETVLLRFTETFPPMVVQHGELEAGQYLNLETSGRPNRVATLEELLLLHLTNQNPAVQPYHELFDEQPLRNTSDYEKTLSMLKEFFKRQPGFGSPETNTEEREALIEILLAPARIAPHSLSAQLAYLLKRWGMILGEGFVQRILRGIDFVKEEAVRGNFAGGFAGGAPVPTFSGHDYSEYERFSPDKDWMPRLVLLAKNSYVWLDQLSKKYQRSITHLDHIPDEELDLLQQRGISGLWLIGLWERSIASQTIKKMMGQADAVASAYSLMDYQIASDLGGWEALQNLRWRAWQRRIRLSADMVPNHIGIDSGWVVEHPDWFLSLPYIPYPNYSFNGVDLSNDSRVGIQIEDHYYDKTDAAVVFRRFDRLTGSTRYVYHGNDGTSMPWNDTAQLDYSKAEVREAIIQTILHVARNFPIIRFDAAMTLAKKHIQRLWFPEPGHGGAIPSRSEHGMNQHEFEAAIPNEFWREVVDRVAAEVPDTLLLAEAFWMMEGYFVRTLGMHRVYNSAFMHMLRDEDNAKYRQVIKNTLEFDPQVLKRYVNFMNNPDEKTAAEQFGTTDKYFGVLTMMVTLPGLPMIGHGQIEGYREKYGMEYRHAKWDEAVDEGLVRGHEWRIFPLMHQRGIFADVENFRLYDFYTLDSHSGRSSGKVNEDVFVYSNQAGDERSLVAYQNKYASTQGWIKDSAAWMDKESGKLSRKNISEALSLPTEAYVVFKDQVTGLEYIRSCQELAQKGLFLDLDGYQCHVFMDWRIVRGEGWQVVCERLNNSGVASVFGKYEEVLGVKLEEKTISIKKVTRKKPKSVIKVAKPTKKDATPKSSRKKTGVNKSPVVSTKRSIRK
jgi:glycosidase